MNINQVRYFVCAYESSSFSVAAKSKSVTVQAVSKAINDLENELGCRLFTRESRSIRPTAAGDALYVKALAATQALDELERFPAYLAAGHEDEVLSVAICAAPFKGSDVIARFLATVARAALGIESRFQVLDPAAAVEGLRRGEVSVLLSVGAFDEPEFDVVTLGTLPTGVDFAPGHPLEAKKSVTLEDLAAYPAGKSKLYDSNPSSIMRMYLRRGLVTNWLPIETSDDAERLLHELDGYFFRALVPVPGSKGGLVERPIDPDEALKVPICLVNLKGSTTLGTESFKRLVSRLPFVQKPDDAGRGDGRDER